MTGGAVMRGAGILNALSGHFVAALPYQRRAVELCQEAEGPLGAARAMVYLGVSGISTGDPTAISYLSGGLELGQQLGDLHSTAVGSTFLAEVSLAFGDVDGARQHVATSEALSRQANDR